MNLAGDLLIVEERLARARRAGVRPLVRTPVVPAIPDHPQEVIAVKRLTLQHTRYEPGQSVWLGGATLREQLAKGAVWIPTSADWFGAPGRVLLAEAGTAEPYAFGPTVGSLRIAMGCAYDPGNAVYRYHTAINEHTKHASTYVKFGGSNPFDCPTQIDGTEDKDAARAYVYSADVVHHHVDYYLSGAGFGPKPRRDQLVIRHYHGSLPAGPGVIQHPLKRENMVKDDALGAVLLGARLTLCALRPDRFQWLPIPVPVARYAAMRPAVRRAGPFRIAHSPTKAEYKGTQVFLDVCDRLNKRGVAVEPVLIGMRRKGKGLEPARKTHAEALRIKADCDAVFDSFWLGIQGSGLEGAAMGLPVIAGDPEVRDLYAEHTRDIGGCPYTYANDAGSLEHEIELLATDVEYRGHETWRVGEYVRRYHDYPRVAERYEVILAKALGRDDVRTP
jgi:glycosyltransferase involved in cell wall biosynthesis